MSRPPIYDPRVYGDPIYDDVLWLPEVYGEWSSIPLAGSVSSDVTIDAPIEAEPSVPRDVGQGGGAWTDVIIRRKPVVVREVHADLTIDAPILGTVGKTIALNHRVHQHVGANIVADAPIRVYTAAEMRIDAPVIDFYDWNRDILLAEIDPDLPLAS